MRSVIARGVASLALVTGASVAAHAQEPEPSPLEARAAGCYALEVESWDPPRSEPDASYQTPPSRVELTLVRGTRDFERDQLLLRPIDDSAAAPMRRRMSYWQSTPADSLRLVWTTGFVGVTISLEPRGDRAAGRATAITDAIVHGMERPTASVEAHRIDCPENGTP